MLERWMTPELFAGTDAPDEYSLCPEGSKKIERRLKKHWRTFISKKDINWIKKQGLNAVRIPVGYWNFLEAPPFISSVEYLDNVMDYSRAAGLKVIIDLHGAPGSQNGWDHSGLSGEINWHKSPDNIHKTLTVIQKIAERYGSEPQLYCIELLNEPHWDIPQRTIEDFYLKGYEIIRSSCPEEVVVIFHDSFRPHSWQKFFQNNNLQNVMLDCHLYQCFSDSDKELDIYGHIQKTVIEWKNLISELQKYVPVIIGEWCLGLDPQSLAGLNETEKLLAYKAYVQTQLLVFERAAGWFFWTYKLENEEMKSFWSYKDLVSGGIVE